MGQFLQELKRRKVLRVAAAYVVASWILLQVADLLAPILELPAWSSKLVFFILLIGFIPALILSWAYDLTADGDNVSSGGDTAAASGSSPLFLAAAIALIGVLAGGWWYSGKDVRWARNIAMAEIESHVESGELESAYALAMLVEDVIPNDPEMRQVWDSFAWTTSIPSTPPGARVFRRAYSDVDAEWQELGVTPLYDIHLPFGASVIRLESEGRTPLLRVLGGGLVTTTALPVQVQPVTDFANVHPENFKIDAGDEIPEGFVRVPGWSELLNGEIVEFRDFFLGRYEVSNREFQEFVDAGGYERRDLWETEFQFDERVLSFDEAMELFVDTSGRAGPGSWKAGAYPDGEADFPVSGVSWYEAAAYARFAGFELPTFHHWRRALSIGTFAWQLPASNLDRGAVAAVGEYSGIGWTGTYDMAGNVHEWCFNPTSDKMRVLVGSAWPDPPDLVLESIAGPHKMPPLDRAVTNGFRLAATNERVAVMRQARLPIVEPDSPKIVEPVSDEVFAARLSDFEYDRSALNPIVEETVEFRHWTRHRITLDSSSGDERIPVYLYLPDRESSRYRTIVIWTGATAMYIDSVDQERMRLDFALRNGYAVVQPILKATYERRVTPPPDWATHSGRDLAIEQVREFRRIVDYLETRPDIDAQNLAYYGHSWGGRVGAIVLSVDSRFKVGILNQAGINHQVHPYIDVVHYLPHVKIPILHFSGLYDNDFDFESSSKPFFDRLGTAETDKKHVVEPTGHFVPRTVTMGETLDWLDKYLGPVD